MSLTANNKFKKRTSKDKKEKIAIYMELVESLLLQMELPKAAATFNRLLNILTSSDLTEEDEEPITIETPLVDRRLHLERRVLCVLDKLGFVYLKDLVKEHDRLRSFDTIKHLKEKRVKIPEHVIKLAKELYEAAGMGH